jgi:predicted AlkP superfamily phosphohydrolase/phosphomutase/tetratricopeptide (TPR) repeat protein
MNRVLLIGWDAADWKVIKPLVEAGQMPNLARLMTEGVHGNLATIYPALSPMLWTSIATGKRAYKHGIHGFAEPLPDGSGVRPITLLSRKTKAIWNILNQTGRRSIVVGWWPSHPAEPLNGVMVSNHFQVPVGRPGELPPVPTGAVHPRALADTLAELRVNPMELDGDFLRLFVPDYQLVDQARDKRLHTLGKIIAETMTVHAVSTELLATQPWDFAALYYAGIDHFGHAFMRYHPPRLPWVTETDFSIYQHVIRNAYRYHDAMLGALLDSCDANTHVVLLSDHGFHPDHLRPGYIPAEPAGPAVEHRHFGIICCKGPQFRTNERLYGAGLLDVCPTLLTLFGLPPGKDMDGKVLVTAFKAQPTLEPIETWDNIEGDSGTHPTGTRINAVASAQAFKQLVELGYVAPAAADSQEAVDETVRELKYNVARSYREGNHCGEAAILAEELWTAWPGEHRFGILFIDCLAALGHVARRREVIEELERRIEKYQAEATLELARRRTAQEESPSDSIAPEPEDMVADPQKARTRFEERHLQELANGRPLLIEWLLVSQALLEKRPEQARCYVEKLISSGAPLEALNQGLASALIQLGEPEVARSLLEQVLHYDPDNAVVHSQLAAMHFEAGRYDAAIASASESLSLLYFQPGIHALLGRALMECKRFTEAEQELKVAAAQSPRNLLAYEWLGELYRQHLDRPEEAFAHEGRALSLRNEHVLRGNATLSAAFVRPEPAIESPMVYQTTAFLPAQIVPPKFAPEVKDSRVVTVVSGLPRSGTSMMMQLLVAAGREALSDSKRMADEDNPLGYFEFEKVLGLAKDASWIPLARGKVIKIVAQLLPFLPPGEHYQIIFMQRELGEVIASQRAMLERQGRSGAQLSEQQLRQTYVEHLNRVRNQLSRRPEIRTLVVDYSKLLDEPEDNVGRIAEFVGEPFLREHAIKSIRPKLRRQRL